MRKDTKTFLSTVLGIPLLLSGVWGVNALNEASVVVFEREPAEEAAPEMPVLVETPKEVVTTTTAPVTPAKKPVAVKPITVPAIVPPPAPVPVVTPVVTPPPAEPTPKPVVVKKSRRTRAS